MMSVDRKLAITARIAKEIRRDHRSLALIIGAPIIVMSLIGFSFQDQKPVLNQAAPALIATMAMFFVFVLTGISFLRERSQGTLERLLSTAVSRSDLLVGYLAGFLLFALIQSIIILMYTLFVVDVEYSGKIWDIILILLMVTITSVSMGIFVSTFAKNEFQVVQFIPLLLAPQIFLSGVILPTSQLPGYFQGISRVLPLTYANRALRDIMLRGASLSDVSLEIGVLALFAVVMLTAASITVRKT
ncbi:MAG TPA: ABC transporter permease [Dehalococcoidia bacterium]|jgi:ABC-2 type transport system permease protein|nr:ABC transporter permease [Dehalococcoidia bacterium]HJP28497.1 ABC transporter permease [Dehalococcoidia bacterium]|tara:strand:- start:7827 stop:8561 length:735 start_codon:yes stop_codon:yes gene_type:complete